MSIRKILFKIRYLQLGRYKTTLIGYIDSWSDSGIVLLDQDKRRHTLQPNYVIRIEPMYSPKELTVEETGSDNEKQPQMDLFEQLIEK